MSLVLNKSKCKPVLPTFKVIASTKNTVQVKKESDFIKIIFDSTLKIVSKIFKILNYKLTSVSVRKATVCLN